MSAGKVEVVARRYDPALHQQLTDRFGGSSVYLRIDEHLPSFTTTVGMDMTNVGRDPSSSLPRGTRQTDYHPWSGGARYRLRGPTPLTPGRCTTGFPWIINKKKYMLTAGHCLPNGGWTWSNASTKLLGGVTRMNRDENWHLTGGTQVIARRGGKYRYNGDLALIPVWAATSIYVGGPTSTAIKQVSGVNPTFVGGGVCTGGSYSGELCGWRVSRVFTDVKYVNGQVARNVAIANKPGPRCVIPGDSGGPVYRAHVRNSVHAHGIISGGGSRANQCSVIFTDVWRAVDLWGGQLHVKRFF